MGFERWSLMDKIILIWGLSIATFALIFICVSLGNLIGENSSNIASWVQAIGSIAAIAAAAMGLKWQMSEGQKLQAEKELRDEIKSNKIKYTVLAYRASCVKEWAINVKNLGLERKKIWNILGPDCLSQLNALNTFTALEFPDPSDISGIDKIKNNLSFVNHFLQNVSGEEDFSNVSAFNALLDKLIAAAEGHRIKYESAAKQLIMMPFNSSQING